MAFSTISTPGNTNYGPTSANMSLDPEVAAARKKVDQSTFGRADELANDPYQKSVMDYLQGTIGGQNVPFSDTVKSSILAQQGAGAASAEEAQMESLRQSLGANGGSIYDPGYQAAQRQAMSQRQGANLDAQGQINAQAGIANQQAQANAANALASARGAQNAQINQMKLAGAGYKSQTFADKPEAGPAVPRKPMPMTPEGPKMDWGQSIGLYH